MLAGLIVVLLTFLPTEYADTTLQLNNKEPQSISNGIAEQAVQLRLPKNLPAGEPVLFEMTLLPAPDANRNFIPGTIFEGRLDLPGAETFPGPVNQVTYQPGQTISFRWLVTARIEDPFAGRLWLTMVVPGPGGGETRTVLLAHPLELELARVVGLSLDQARWTGGGIVGIGLVVLLLELRKAKSTHSQKRKKIMR